MTAAAALTFAASIHANATDFCLTYKPGASVCSSLTAAGDHGGLRTSNPPYDVLSDLLKGAREQRDALPFNAPADQVLEAHHKVKIYEETLAWMAKPPVIVIPGILGR